MARKTIKTAEDKPAIKLAENIDNHQTMLNENQTSPESAQADYMAYTRSRCGGALRTVREKQGLSVQDVAGKLKISSQQIEAIEADQFADLPESTIVRGFIRNYAKLLKMQAEPLLDAYHVLVPNKEPLAFTIKPTSSMKVGGYQKPKTGRNLIAVLLILLALGIWYFYQNYIDKPNPTLPIASGENIETDENIESLPIPDLPAAERVEQSVDIQLPVATPDAASNLADGENLSTATPLNGEQASSAALANTGLPELKPAETLAGMTKLEFNANQETWVSVVDDAGKEIYNKVIFAGSRDNLSVKLPINVIVGNASGVTVMMNNKLVDLAPHTRSNVARVRVDSAELNQFE